MMDKPRIRTHDEYKNDAERVREHYRREGEARERAKKAHPASQKVETPLLTDTFYDAGKTVERVRVLGLLVDELVRTSGGTFDAKSVLTKLIKAVLDDR